jgi:hypothetical protein
VFEVSARETTVAKKVRRVLRTGRCVAARPDDHEELWTMRGVTGKTWNHPVIAGGRVYLRNATELVAFDLPRYVGEPAK